MIPRAILDFLIRRIGRTDPNSFRRHADLDRYLTAYLEQISFLIRTNEAVEPLIFRDIQNYNLPRAQRLLVRQWERLDLIERYQNQADRLLDRMEAISSSWRS